MDVEQAHIPPAPSSTLDIYNCSVPGESAMVVQPPTHVLQQLQTPVKEANSSSTTRYLDCRWYNVIVFPIQERKRGLRSKQIKHSNDHIKGSQVRKGGVPTFGINTGGKVCAHAHVVPKWDIVFLELCCSCTLHILYLFAPVL